MKYRLAVVKQLIYSLTFLFGLYGSAAQAQNHSIQEILALLERGQLASASRMLQINLQINPSDAESRILLGSIMEHSGMRAEAIRLWQQGLQNNPSDYPLLLSIGEGFLNEAEARIQEDRTPSSLLPVIAGPTESDCAEFLDSAIASFQQAAVYYPHEAEPLYLLANAFQLKNDYEQALHYAELLARIYPNEEKNHTLKGLLLLQTGDYERSEESLQQALSLNPTYSPALKAMAELMMMKDRIEEAAELMRKAAFYDFIPSFIRLPFHEKNYRLYSQLVLTDHDDEESENALRDLLAPLLEDKSNESTQWLAMMFWQQAIPADLDEIAWEEFTSRGIEAQRLMMEMAQHTENWTLLGRLCRKMVQLQTPGIFELLTRLLPKDKMMDSPLRIAYCMATLGDDLAVPYLVNELRRHTDDEDDYHFSQEGERAARRRAALALSYFNTPLAVEALKEGLADEEISPYCAAALYRLTLEETYLQTLQTMATNGKIKDAEIVHFLRLTGACKAEQVADMMED